MLDFERVIISKEKDIATKIEDALSQYSKFDLEYSIDWSEYECSKGSFYQFSIDKLSKSMAYGTETISKEEAEKKLKKFIEKFENDCRFFTNWDDVEILKEKANGWTPITKYTFDCCLIILDKHQVGVMVMIDED